MIKISIKLTYEEVKECVENKGYELISTKYISNSKKLIIKDRYGYYYTINLKNLKSGSPPCFVEKRNPYSIQNIKLWCKLNNKPFILLSEEYKGNKENLKWQCLKEECEEIFEMCWKSILIGTGCNYCAGRQVGLSNCLATKNQELASEWHPANNGNLTPYDVTCGNDRKVWWLCNKGHEWKSAIASRNQGKNCPYCAGLLPSKENNLLICNPKLCEEWDYEKNKKRPEDYCPNSNKKVWWKCGKCNHKWKTTINSRNNNVGCSQCKESKGEKEISRVLTKYNIPHNSQYTFDDLRGIGKGLLKFDSSVFWDKEMTKLRTIIEYDGQHHFKPVCFGGISIERAIKNFKKQVENDIKKNLYCAENNIQLIRIPYWEYDNIEKY